jgi:uncharacterized protein YndB with AHSA1/START domain
MESANSSTPNSPTHDLVIKRIIDAPVELVWRLWTEPEHVMRWWGPQFYTSPSCEIDLRVGGRFVFCMRAPAEQGGADSFTSGMYQRIIPFDTLEFTQYLSDASGEPLDPEAAGMPPGFPTTQLHTVTFRPRRDMTELTIIEHAWPISPMIVYALAGMHQSIDKLCDLLESQP